MDYIGYFFLHPHSSNSVFPSSFSHSYYPIHVFLQVFYLGIDITLLLLQGPPSLALMALRVWNPHPSLMHLSIIKAEGKDPAILKEWRMPQGGTRIS